MRDCHYISSSVLGIEEVREIIEQRKTLDLSEEAISNIEKARKYLDNQMKENETPVYGINTGFGSSVMLEFLQKILQNFRRIL